MSRPLITPEVVHLLEAGESPIVIAQRVGRRLDSVGRALHRAGLTSHARAFWNESDRQRGRVKA